MHASFIILYMSCHLFVALMYAVRDCIVASCALLIMELQNDQYSINK